MCALYGGTYLSLMKMLYCGLSSIENDGYCYLLLSIISSVQSLSHVQLFATPWTAAHPTSLSITNTQSLLKLMSIKLVMPSDCRILCHPLLLRLISFPESRSFQMSEFLSSGGQSTGVTGSTSVLSMNIQD